MHSTVIAANFPDGDLFKVKSFFFAKIQPTRSSRSAPPDKYSYPIAALPSISEVPSLARQLVALERHGASTDLWGHNHAVLASFGTAGRGLEVRVSGDARNTGLPSLQPALC